MSQAKSVLPAHVAERAGEMSLTALRTAVALGRFMNREGRCFPSAAAMARAVNVSRSAIFRGLKELEKMHLLGRKRRGPHPNDWQWLGGKEVPDSGTSLKSQNPGHLDVPEPENDVPEPGTLDVPDSGTQTPQLTPQSELGAGAAAPSGGSAPAPAPVSDAGRWHLIRETFKRVFERVPGIEDSLELTRLMETYSADAILAGLEAMNGEREEGLPALRRKLAAEAGSKA